LVAKPTPAHPELGIRREADYPAYTAETGAVRRQVWELGRELERVLPTLGAPVLVVGSNDDPWVPVANAERLAARLPNAELLVVDGPGHAITLDPKGGEVFAAIRRFVSGAGR
jgi:pimeloyl-ACP methyl ester carboxylesterase